MAKSLSETNTGEKLQLELTNLEHQYQPERLEGLPIKALEGKARLAVDRYEEIISGFPRRDGLKGPWRALAHGDIDESLSPLTQEQQKCAFDTLERCIDNITEVATKREDKQRTEESELISVDSLESIISLRF
ncbi:hypothetical protein [Haloarcula salinisoli]|uniref:Uncharacterized protein n=1 Tax=Haloarcula salinisoli TaxID=2487746 RepID=A0A8J8C8P5_9EURY|nr:hypothetical protein [Halomicroarcula salinisoli]MBX0287702.1 hypothetical protein [Halomicroarcula salinisoli]MBX0304631.1 hypothetical protein [Halomicroarcula salinisoli]